jgi:hypothetical protein
MRNSFSKFFLTQFLTPLIVLILASFAVAPMAEAAGRGGHAGGGHAGGGGARAGGGAKHNVKANHSRADVRTNNVRSSSDNNVNVNKNVNVNVANRGGCCNNGWDNDYHPVATAVAVGATVAVTSAIVGSMVRTVPAGCVPVNYGGMIYQQCGSTWYQPQGSQYVVINPPY